MSGLRPFYCPVELRFCVRPYSDIGVRFRPIFALYAKKSEVENNTNALDIIKFVFEKGFVITIKEYVTLLMNSERTDIIQYLSTKINTN